MAERLDVELPRPACAYCKAPVRIDEDKQACPGCMSWSHAECVLDHGGCPACGAGVPQRAPAPAPGKQAAEPAERPRAPSTEPVDPQPSLVMAVFAGTGVLSLVGFSTYWSVIELGEWLQQDWRLPAIFVGLVTGMLATVLALVLFAQKLAAQRRTQAGRRPPRSPEEWREASRRLRRFPRR